MTPFTTITGPAAPLMLDNVDTDIIIRIERLYALGRDQLGPCALEALRFTVDGAEDPSCVLNRPVFRAAPALLAGRNFGCGSSREGAVWALAARGVRCVMAESFGDIFFGNCFQNGMLPIVLPRPDLDALAAQAADGAPVTVDLQQRVIVFPDGRRLCFMVDDMKRTALLDGMDEIARSLSRKDAIAAWQARDHERRPWLWAPVRTLGRDPGTGDMR